MNQEQAKKFIKLYETLPHPEIVFNHHHVANLEHIERFSKVGVYQWRDFYGEWISSNDINFCGEPENYRLVPERKINWEKAMKNGAWGQEFLFSTRELPNNWEARVLTGYDGTDFQTLPFCSRTITKYEKFQHAKPFPGFVVPEAWSDEE